MQTCNNSYTGNNGNKTKNIRNNNNNNIKINGGSNDHENGENTVFVLAVFNNGFDVVVHSFDVVVAVVNLLS